MAYKSTDFLTDKSLSYDHPSCKFLHPGQGTKYLQGTERKC